MIPNHIAFICDGNGRWATAQGKKRTYGHKMGEKVFEPVVNYLLKQGVSTITFFVFSTENWKRSEEEVNYLMERFEYGLKSQADMAMKKNLRIRILGRRDRISKKILTLIEKIEKDTSENTAGTLCFCLDYGGQNDIAEAGKQIALDAKNGIIEPENINEEIFGSYLPDADIIPIDLVVRTSMERRISNFMLWHLAYSELVFIPEYWPEMNEKILARILDDYQNRDRRFGGLNEKK